MSRILRVAVAVLVAAMLLLIPNRPVLAGSSVDPSTLNPPPQSISGPPGTVISCQANGRNIICQGLNTTQSWHGDIGTLCTRVDPSYTFDVAENYRQTWNFTWWYNAARDITRAQLHVQSTDVLTNTATGVTARNTGGVSDDLFFGTPGDWSSVTETLTGVSGRFSGRGSGNVIHDVGKALFLPDGSAIFHGQFDSAEDGQPYLPAICTALAA